MEKEEIHMKAKAAFLTDIRKIEMGEIDIPDPEATEIQIKLEYVGICGSDVHFYEHGRIGTKQVTYPFILGHECSGKVTKIGKSARGFAIGDPVALEPGVPCGRCEYCKDGKYNICPDVKFMAAPPTNGAFVEYINHPAHMTFGLPSNVSLLEGALVEPLAVGMHAARQGEVIPGKTVIILGAGCIGLTTLLACKSMGASNIVVTDLYDKRLAKAKELGAKYTVNVSNGDAIASLQALVNGEGYDLVFETAGTNITAAQTGYLVRRGGTIVIVGNIPGDTSFNFRNLTINEATLKTVFRYRNIYPTAIDEIAAGRIDVKSIVSDEYGFESTHEAFERALCDKETAVKVVVKM